jgi:multisubunit Na+/H+ antiporter MnhG subunit
MIIGLLMISLPIFGIFWVPYAGHWVQFSLSLIGLCFAVIIYKMIAKHAPERRPMNIAQLVFAVFTVLFSIIGAAVETDALSRYEKCESDYQKQMSDYYSNYNSCYSSGANSFCYAASYPYNDCYNYLYAPGAIATGGAITPILELVRMILFSITCSYVWNFAKIESMKYHPKAPAFAAPLTDVARSVPTGIVAMPDGGIVVPAQLAGSYFAWLGQQQSAPGAVFNVQPPVVVPMPQVGVQAMTDLPPYLSSPNAVPSGDEKH